MNDIITKIQTGESPLSFFEGLFVLKGKHLLVLVLVAGLAGWYLFKGGRI